jgi:23S rRNA (cytidine1920-2'-O)/16S rRNA (cytidine1409-2'-O)-methyltransferase
MPPTNPKPPRPSSATKPKTRLDHALVDRGLLPTRAMARSWVMAGDVYVNQQRVDKAGTLVKPTDAITLTAKSQYVSRGGDKLAHALQAFNMNVTGQLCLDVGASTGGFTDCLLQHGAAHVVALDVGHNQLHWQLRQHPQVTCIEQTHIKDYAPQPPNPSVFDWVVADVSFISLMAVLPHMVALAKPGTGQLVTLLKPQFEYGRYMPSLKGFNGVVNQPGQRHQIVQAFLAEAATVLPHWQVVAMAVSPLKGAKGNVEYLLWWKPD